MKKENIINRIDGISSKIDAIEKDLKALLNGDEPFKEEFEDIKDSLSILKKEI